MRSKRWWLPVVGLSVALIASSCGGGGGEDISRLRQANAGDVRPPDQADAGSLALPGLTLQTNSPSMRQLVNSAEGEGAVILFVQPGGAADNKDIARGDLLVEVDGRSVANHEHALTLLRSHENEERTLRLVGSDGNEKEVTIVGELPRQRPRPILDAMLRGNPNDPVLRYLRAQSVGGTTEGSLEDLQIALDRAPNFVEALSARGNIMWNRRPTTEDQGQQEAFAVEALANWRQALDIDPRHADTLTLMSVAKTVLGNPEEGRADALRAVEIDGTLAAANAALARAEVAAGNPEAAAGPARAAVELNPYTNLTYYRILANIFRILERPEDCAATLTAVVPYLEGTGVDALATEAQQLQREAQEDCD